MSKVFMPVLELACIAASLVAYFGFRQYLMALMLCFLALVAAHFSGWGSQLEGIKSGKAVDPKAVKEYRASHPGASIAEAVNALRDSD